MPLSQKTKSLIIVIILFAVILAPFCFTIFKESGIIKANKAAVKPPEEMKAAPQK